MGCCPLKFLHVLQFDQALLAHTPAGTGVPKKILIVKKFKIWLKIQRVSPYNFRASGSILTKLFPRDVLWGRGDKMGISFGRQAPWNFWVRKNLQNSARFLTTFHFVCEYLRNGSIYCKSEEYFNNYNPFHVGSKKLGELCFANNRVVVAHIDQSKVDIFWETTFPPLWGAAPSNF